MRVKAEIAVFIIRLLLLLSCITVFAALYIMLAENNRPSGDDFEFLNLLRNYGWWDAMVVYWNAWNTRWLALLFLNSVNTIYNALHNFYLYHIVTLLALSVALFRLLRIQTLKLKLASASIFYFFSSTLLLISFFFVSFDITESFFWINANQMYLWSVIFIIFGFNELNRNEYKLTSWLIVTLSFFYVGGAFESYAIVALLSLIILLIYEFQKKEKNKIRMKLLILSIFFLCLSFSIELFGTGWRNRHEILGSPTLLSAIFITAKAFVKMFIYYIPQKIIWVLLFFLVWIGTGTKIKGESAFPFPKYFLLKVFVVFCIASLLILFPSCYLLRETPPFRTWTLVCFLFSLFICIAGFVIGNKLRKYTFSNYISTGALAAIAVLLIITYIEQKKITTTYAAAFDAREKVLVDAKLNHTEGIIELEPLPPSGLLHSAEISSDTSYYENRHVKDYYQLKCAVRKKPLQP
jgi:hypothetical protein